MRNVLQTEGPARTVAADLGLAAIISLVLTLPFAILESLFNVVNKQNAPGLVVLFGLLWLLPTAFIVILALTVRAVRAGNGTTATPVYLLLRVALLGLIAMTWGGILIDQLPCFLGVPNCD